MENISFTRLSEMRNECNSYSNLMLLGTIGHQTPNLFSMSPCFSRFVGTGNH